jgi:para-nitrobenzyl esterase
MMKKNGLLYYLLAGLAVIILVGCSSGSSGGGTSTPPATSGVFFDSPIQGLDYATPTWSGVTDANGKFSYGAGETVTFSLGGLVLGSVTGQSTVTLFTIVPTATSVNDQKLVNIAKFLQSLDSGGDITTRIVISDATKAAIRSAGSINFDQSTAAFAADPKVVSILAAMGKTLCTDAEAIAHINSQMAALALINTGFGNVQGKLSSVSSSLVWSGIPYAAPPVGSLRWKAPTDPTPWATTLSTIAPGKACVQQGTLSDKLLGTIAQDEDCLTLNIWRPASEETNLPVLVFVHGGSNVSGYGAYSFYWGGNLASEQKVVFVSINYRLNLFGWLYHSALQTGDPLSNSGNYGTLDIVQALKFVKNNIANFGGDPNNITLSGQSAGSTNTWTLIASPQAAGLFHKAMPMSMGFGLTTKAASTTFGDKLLAMLVRKDGLAADNASAVTYIAANLSTDALKKTYLYSKTAAQLMTAYTGIANDPNNPSNYFVSAIGDGVVIPPDWDTAFTGNYLNNVPVLSGVTNEEGKYWGSYFALPNKWVEMLVTTDPDNPTITSIDQIIQPAYLPADKAFTACNNTGYNAITLNAAFVNGNYATYCSNSKYNTTFVWWHQTITLNKYQPLQPKTYAYNFAWAQEPVPFNTVFGAAHASDVPLLFGNDNTVMGWVLTFGYSTANKAGREALSLKMRKSLKAFMSTGDPNNASLGVTWLPWSTTSGSAKRLIFDADYNNASITMSTSDTPIPR